MKLLPLLAALPLLCASVVSANSLMSVGYFNGGGDVTAGPGGDIDKLDVRQITHLNYSFGLIYNNEKDETNDALKDASKLHQIWLSEKVQSDLQKIPELRKQNPNLKVLLSVGGWGARGFSGAAATKESRAVFIQSVQDVIAKYGLDGIDLDWEYPVNGAWGLVESKPADRANFTTLLKELRAAVGHKKLVTIAVGANAESPKSWVDVKAIAPLLDYINLMTYDMAYGTQYFNSNLYDSTTWPTVAEADKYSADFVVNNYLAAGLKPAQMNLGIGFYGRVPKRAVEPGIDWSKPDAQKNPATQPYFEPQQIALFKSLGVDLSKDTYVKYNDIVAKLINDPQKRFTQHWDDEAKVPWLSVQSADGKALFALSYENPRSVAIKADYIKSKGLGGAMFWEYGADDKNQLAKQLADSLGIKH
ncbi:MULTISPECIES: glycoside hydrolase family 18 protein [unclassified Citrobacter]|uniref:glycoside hydrolase family 18 protein n=1 Tax=unclassified Citrobacter TaxID=2644389 RepID=UPI0017E7C268|nr:MULTISPECIES: glycoside hydrolase family 18 protein [unclassified Citrobacter]HCJ6374227.1 glycoside hydrolase family 18 protein [Citrobacter freundii]MBA7967827.1 glycoside hydrolase family 18 protein [Citrobacter sp. RHBSTW-00671]MDW2645219.1 glycoside hydrolase family 18 protein [Citrobacter sp. HN-141]MDW2654666.1 glycoside hydrolase family 18 protein [Citrobacter sp. HN-120]MDW2697691.1 glycoside hydrolase family 18 protein [Citrobacter sp. HN-144]